MVSYKEGPHPASFILSEAQGQRSRDNRTIGENQDFAPGTIVTGGPDVPNVPWTTGVIGPGAAITIYGVKTGAGEQVDVAVISRDAEVNRHCIAWPDGTTEAAKDTAAADLAALGIIVRGAAPASP